MKERIANRYEFDRLADVIGRGGMGIVFRGIDTQTQMMVAIKQLSPELIRTNADVVARFIREADVLRKLDHPNIIRVLDVINDVELGHYLVMEYVDSGSLWDELQATRQLPIPRALSLARGIASALMVVHQNGVVHRDIKPANILIALDKSPRLSDFGVVYVADRTRLTNMDGIVGTLDYLAPEVLNGQLITVQADIWAFGVMLYEMVAGKRPFSNESMSALFHAILTKQQPDLLDIRPDASTHLINLINWMLAKDLESRVGNMQTVYQTLTEIMAGQDTPSIPIPSTRRKLFKRIGTLPKFFADDPFYDRQSEQATISNYVTERKPFIGIYGRGGIGKTALGSKVLGDVEKGSDLDGIIYLRANSTPILNSEMILDALAKLLPEADEFHGKRADNQIPFIEKVRLVLNGLSEGRYVMFIDNFDTLQHPENHAVMDDAIRDFLNLVLEMRGNGALSLIITTRYPIPFSNTLKPYEITLRLDEGLPLADAIQFLRGMDTKNTLPADDAQLAMWTNKVGGFPRGLEALVGYLNGGETRHIDDLLDDPSLFEGEVLSNVVGQIHEALPQDFRRVLAGVAVIGQSTARVELDYLLSPYIETAKIRTILERLVEGRFLVYNRQNRTYSLHPIDREYALSSTPKGSSQDADSAFTQYILNKRMADYHLARRKPKEQWKTIDDLYPQLREIEYRYQCGEYDAIVLPLQTISHQYLFYWGYVDFVIDWFVRLEKLVQKPEILLELHYTLVIGYWHLVNYQQSLHHAQIALSMAQQQMNQPMQAKLVGNLAVLYYSRGKMDEAIVYMEQALTLAKEMNNLNMQGIQLGNLGGAYYSMGELEKATAYYQRSLEASRQASDKVNESRQLVNLGEVMSILNRPDEAIVYLKESIRVSEEINATAMIQNNWIFLARAYWLFADLNNGLEAIQQAFSLNHDSLNRGHYGMVLYGCLSWCSGHTEKAVELFHEAIELTDKVLAIASDNFEALYSRALAWAGLWIATSDTTYYQQATVAYQDAKQITSTKGTLFEKRQLLETLLTYTDKDGAEILALLA